MILTQVIFIVFNMYCFFPLTLPNALYPKAVSRHILSSKWANQEVKLSTNKYASLEETCEAILVEFTTRAGHHLAHLWGGWPWACAPFWLN